MRLESITAVPHPRGNRIDLTWINPDPESYPRVRVVRCQRTHPISIENGAVVPQFGLALSFQTELDAPEGAPSPALQQQFARNRAPLTGAATIVVDAAGSSWRIVDGEQEYVIKMNEHRLDVHNERLSFATDEELKGETTYYYSLFPYQDDPAECQIDHHNRAAALATAPYDMAGQMYDLLPRIYHRYDTVLPKADEVAEEDRQRGLLRRFLDLPGSQLDQIRSFARAALDLYDVDRVDGRLLPLLAQWIDWQTDHRQEIDTQRNDIRSAPHVYQRIGIIPTVEATVKRVIGWESHTKEFAHNVFRSNCPERLNVWLRRRDADGAWSEPTEPLSLDAAYEGRPAAARDQDDALWLFYHTLRNGRWDIWYKVYRENQGWAPSCPLTRRAHIDQHPTAALQGETLWVFWDSYDDADHTWHIDYRTRTGGEWSPIQTFAGPEIECRHPWVVSDHAGGLWLFWLQREESGWQLRYNRHNGSTWERGLAGAFPADDREDPRVESDLFVLHYPHDPELSLWVFWARKTPTGEPGQTRWQIAYRVKTSIDPMDSDWSEVRTLPKAEPGDDDREPAALVTDRSIEVVWSSNRGGSWSIWCSKLSPKTHWWSPATQITDAPHSQRDPLPMPAGDETWLVYRSNESLAYASDVYGATETLDARYAGCTTVDTRNPAKIALRGHFEDFQTYTYDTGRNSLDWYARDTVGIYLTPDTEDPALIVRNRNLINAVLRRFLPIQVRPVYIIEPAVHAESIYTYDFPTTEPQRRIGEMSFDSTFPEMVSGLEDAYRDTVPGWVWLYAWDEAHLGHHTVDLDTDPVDLRFRTWHTGLESGE